MIILPDGTPHVNPPLTPRQWADDHGEPLTLERDPEPEDLGEMDPLHIYTAIYQEVADLRREHADLFDELAQLERHLATAQSDLTNHARQYGEMGNDIISVTVAYPVSRTWDGVHLVRLMPGLRDIPGIITTRVEVNAKKLEGLVKLGIVDGDTIAPALREEPLTPRVTIKAVTR